MNKLIKAEFSNLPDHMDSHCLPQVDYIRVFSGKCLGVNINLPSPVVVMSGKWGQSSLTIQDLRLSLDSMNSQLVEHQGYWLGDDFLCLVFPSSFLKHVETGGGNGLCWIRHLRLIHFTFLPPCPLVKHLFQTNFQRSFLNAHFKGERKATRSAFFFLACWNQNLCFLLLPLIRISAFH